MMTYFVLDIDLIFIFNTLVNLSFQTHVVMVTNLRVYKICDVGKQLKQIMYSLKVFEIELNSDLENITNKIAMELPSKVNLVG